MWTLLRTLALTIVVVVAVLASGSGGWLLGLADRAAGALGAGGVPRGGSSVSSGAVALGLLAGAVATVVGPARRAVEQVVTLLHELGHTLAAAALGARPAGIVLRHDASGHATARWRGGGRRRRLSLAATAFVGLPAPTVAAAAGAGLLTVAGPRAVLWSVASAGAVVATLARSVWSLLVAAGLVALALAGLAEWAQPWAVGAVVGLLTGLALSGATTGLRRLGRPIADGDDARAVRRAIPLPPRLVLLVQVATAVAAAGWTVWLLVAAAGCRPVDWRECATHLGIA